MNVSEPEPNLFNKTNTTTCLLFLILSFSTTTTIIFFSGDVGGEPTSIFPLTAVAAAFAAVLVGGFVVLAVRTTVVAWITVLVLLAFAGKRRRVLCKDGNKITSEVAAYAANAVVKERSILAFAGVMILGLMTMALLRKPCY